MNRGDLPHVSVFVSYFFICIGLWFAIKSNLDYIRVRRLESVASTTSTVLFEI